MTRKFYFLDCLCIHQTDIKRKIEGIRHLAGFVAMSKTIYIMWDDIYFTRLWCVYEVAVFKAANPNAPMRIIPLRLSVAIIILVQ